jgi:hypothetical protein
MIRTSIAKRILFAASVVLGMSSAAFAASVQSYGNVVDPPGVYFGSGNVNGNWTIVTNNGVEVALRAKIRGGATIDGSSGIYHTGMSAGPYALWNYELSVNTQAGGTRTLTDVIIDLMVDVDPGAGTNFHPLNALTNWNDSDFWSTAAHRRTASPALPGPQAGEFGIQISQNPRFSSSGFGFNPGPGLYDLVLNVRDLDHNLLASVGTQVQVPEPGTLALLGISLAGLAFVRRNKKAV